MKTTTHMLIPLTALACAFAQGPVQPQPGRMQPQPPQPQQQRLQQPQPNQPRQPQPQNFDALKSYLNLTDSQIRQMQQAREKAAKDADEKSKTLRPQIEEKHRALADLLDKDNADALTVGRAMLEIRGLERQMRQAHEAVRNAEVNVMTLEQRTKFKAIQEAALLPEATREAQWLGLVPGPPPQGPGMGPRPQMQGPGGPMPIPQMPNGPEPGRMMRPQAPMLPPNPPIPPRQGGEEGGR